jgi:membrane-associated phospholipid phosphatase
MIRTGCIASITLAGALVSLPASADTVRPTAPGDRVHYNLTIDIPVTIAAGVLALGSQILSPVLARAECQWCDRDAEGNDTLNCLDKAARNALVWSSPNTADTLSHVFGFGISPAAAVGFTTLAGGLDDRLNEAPANALLMFEASLTAATFTQLVRLAVGRERPYVHQLTPDEKKKTYYPSDNNGSFFSGHANFAFALALSSGTIASLRGYRYAPLVWATGLPIAVTSAYLRIAADHHYLTDVLVGSIVGTSVGFLVPFLFHRGDPPATGAPSSSPSSGAQAKPSWTPSGITAAPAGLSMTWPW